MTDNDVAIVNARFLQDRVKNVKKQFQEFGIGRQNLVTLLDKVFKIQIKLFLTGPIRKGEVSN